jgi:uncharacterized protein (DUF433 family)
MSVVNSTHIWIDDRGAAWIDQTNLKVTEIALERIAHGSSVDEIVDQHKGLITLAQAHAALAHYYDYQEEFECEIEKQLMRADQMRLQNPDGPGRVKLKQLGRIR